jgi:hypothetical protein
MHPTDSALNRTQGTRRRFHALVFDAPAETLAAVKRLRVEGFEVHDVYSPFALHGVDEALGLRPSRLGIATLIGGLVGGGAAFAFQIWTHAIDWPLFIGGKTPLALPAQVPVSFELTVLFAAFATVGTLVVRRRLFPRLAPEPVAQPDPRVTDDRFVVLVVERDASFSPARFRSVAASLHPSDVREAWQEL